MHLIGKERIVGDKSIFRTIGQHLCGISKLADSLQAPAPTLLIKRCQCLPPFGILPEESVLKDLFDIFCRKSRFKPESTLDLLHIAFKSACLLVH